MPKDYIFTPGITLRSDICIEPGCNIRATFNVKGETKRLYCRNHKKENMVNVINNDFYKRYFL